MDLGAYANIENLAEIAERNNIIVPRLRGYRLMSEEESVNINDLFEGVEVSCVERLCRSQPFWSTRADSYLISDYTDYLKRYYLVGKNGGGFNVRWERIHGWKRKTLKTCIHNKKQEIRRQYETWNKYAGKDGFLYIHARIGGGNWPYYFKDVIDKPWFIEKVDDSFDSTYCDIYARIEHDN